jgi:hypothetical protein
VTPFRLAVYLGLDRYELSHLERRMIKKVKGQMGSEMSKLKRDNEVSDDWSGFTNMSQN